jgi:VanZ family protein
MSPSSRAVLRRSPAPLALMALIFYLSAQSDPGPDVPRLVRMLVHAGEFGLLTVLWAWALSPAARIGRGALIAAAIAFVYAVSDEYHQSFVPGRDGDPFDVLIDSVGIAIAVLILRTDPVRSRIESRAGWRPPGPRDAPGTRPRA